MGAPRTLPAADAIRGSILSPGHRITLCHQTWGFAFRDVDSNPSTHRVCQVSAMQWHLGVPAGAVLLPARPQSWRGAGGGCLPASQLSFYRAYENKGGGDGL